MPTPLALCLALALVRQRPALAPAPAPQAAAVREGALELPGATLRWTERGAGAPVLVLSGGPGFSGSYMLPVAEHLASGHRSLLLDQRGTGRSTVKSWDPKDFTVAAAVEDLERLRVHLGLARWTILGHSWGGMLAQAYAAKHWDRLERLVLLDPGGPTPAFGQVFWDNLSSRMLPSDKEALTYWSAPERAAQDPDRAELEKLRALLPGEFFERSRVHEFLAQLGPGDYSPRMARLVWKDLQAGYDLRESLKAVKAVPTLVLQGRQDPMGEGTAREVQSLIPGARLTWVERAGHYPWLERPEATWKALDSFIEEAK